MPWNTCKELASEKEVRRRTRPSFGQRAGWSQIKPSWWGQMDPSQPADVLAHYLHQSDTYDYLHLMLFCHGVESVGLATVDQWKAVLEHARVAGSFAGVEPGRYPSDLATFFRYQSALRAIPARYPIPEPLPLQEFDRFVAQRRHRYPAVTMEA